MQREAYDAYLACFHSRDYGRVLEHFTDDCEVDFAGYRFKGHNAIGDFYAFFHEYVDERILVTRFVSDGRTIALEANVRLEGIGELTAELLASKGFDRLVTLGKEQIVELPQIIHYHLRDGKFDKVFCTIVELPMKTISAVGKSNESF